MKNKRENNIITLIQNLDYQIDGDVFANDIWRHLYATDASAYREMPLAVVRPKHKNDIQQLIRFAQQEKIALIPRTAGTSLAGQVVGSGIIVDVSKYMTNVLEVNEQERWIRVQPGVILEEMNLLLKDKGLFFGPETSTANRCMMGGMVGNNSCGLHSLAHGSTRDHTLSLKGFLSDGSEVEFKDLSMDELEKKLALQNLEGDIYRKLHEILSNPDYQDEIKTQYPHPEIPRRNTGYALDMLLRNNIYGSENKPLNITNLICGSEGTLFFIMEIKLNLLPLPPKYKALVCAHFDTLKASFYGNLVALRHQPTAIELMDKKILDLTEGNLTQRKNRFFLEGHPEALLFIEMVRESQQALDVALLDLIEDFKHEKLGYSFPIVTGTDIAKVWNLRKAGLGVLSNIPGDAKPVSVIEDTAVLPEDLPQYMEEFGQLIEKHQLDCVYHAHIATGELHLRPILDLKVAKDVNLFREVARETALLVKKYKGSLSGEHGDGRLRGEFIPLMVGDKVYDLMKEVKAVFDPNHIFNPNKIVDTPTMNTALRYETGVKTKSIDTIFNFSATQGYLRMAEKCNGSGDCRKTHLSRGTMCPSYQATKDENATTRARANILREYITHSQQKNPFNHQEIYQVLDLCLSCKGCKSECPSNVDMAKLKAEFLQHYYDDNGIPIRTRAIAYISSINKMGAIVPFITNFFLKNGLTSSLMKKMLGFAPKRSIPLLYKITLKHWAKKHLKTLNPTSPIKKVYLFCDEFTDYNDTEIGIHAIQLLTALGYHVEIPQHTLSGRTFLSKGLLRKAKKIAIKNVSLLKDIVSEESPLLGIEPSGILAFRDEYPDLVDEKDISVAKKLAKSCLMLDEFLVKEFELGHISSEQFSKEKKNIKLHGHCQQKAIASTEAMKKMLSIPEHFSVEEILSGCCGMAGSFGYEKEHYDLSMKIGSLVLFPAVKKANAETLISAPGTSCRHQIKDGTGRTALHPIEIMWEALEKN